MRRAAIVLLALALACAPRSEGEAETRVPQHLAVTVDGWTNAVVPLLLEIWKDRGGGPKGQWKWTDAELASLQATRASARQAIATASAEDRQWLLIGYVGLFGPIGLGSEWADAVLEVPPNHPGWTTPWHMGEGLYDALLESEDPLRFRQHIAAVAAEHDRPHIQAVALYVELEQADRTGDWERAQAAYARLQAPELERGQRAFEASLYLNPDRALRTERQVPHFCGPAIAGPHAGQELCLDELFLHDRPDRPDQPDQPTLIIGWASWCGPCNEQLPQVIELVRDRPLRVITINYYDDAERAREHLRELGVEDWTILQLTVADSKRREHRGPLDQYPIPYLALVDGQGMTVAGPPWLDAETLAARLTVD